MQEGSIRGQNQSLPTYVCLRTSYVPFTGVTCAGCARKLASPFQKIHRSFSRQILARFSGGSLKGEDMHEPWRPLKLMDNLDKIIRKR